MIEPSKIAPAAQRYEDENINFRTFLKNRADPDELDTQFLELHNELLAGYDCCKCANCCKTCSIIVQADETAAIARYLKVSEVDFIADYLAESDDPDEGRYKIKSKPCVFLQDDGKCSINDCKPSVCRSFPHTDKPDRIASMMSILGYAEVCPVVFEILERLKKIYRFKRR